MAGLINNNACEGNGVGSPINYAANIKYSSSIVKAKVSSMWVNDSFDCLLPELVQVCKLSLPVPLNYYYYIMQSDQSPTTGLLCLPNIWSAHGHLSCILRLSSSYPFQVTLYEDPWLLCMFQKVKAAKKKVKEASLFVEDIPFRWGWRRSYLCCWSICSTWQKAFDYHWSQPALFRNISEGIQLCIDWLRNACHWPAHFFNTPDPLRRCWCCNCACTTGCWYVKGPHHNNASSLPTYLNKIVQYRIWHVQWIGIWMGGAIEYYGPWFFKTRPSIFIWVMWETLLSQNNSCWPSKL